MSTALLAPSSWLRLPPRTARLRLTLLYAGLFLVSGTCVLALVYGLASRGSSIDVAPAAIARAIALKQSASRAAPTVGSVQVRPLKPGVLARDPVGAQRSADLGRLLEVSWLALAVTSVASAILGWIAAGRVLRPLRSITDTARTISAGSLHQRLALTGPEDEFKRLGDTLDDLLGRLQASFDAQRRFVANASHELRTPLTVERTLLQVALADPDASTERLRSTCEELLASSAEHERLLESLLTLATSERGLERCEPFDLGELGQTVLDGGHAGVDRLGLQVDGELGPAPVAGDPALARRLVANLIDNASDHNLPGGQLTVRTATEDGHAVLTVTNTGPPIADDEVERLFEPFHRGPETRAADSDGHHGLGLSIVRAIAAAHHGSAHVRARPGGGLVAEVRFPSREG